MKERTVPAGGSIWTDGSKVSFRPRKSMKIDEKELRPRGHHRWEKRLSQGMITWTADDLISAPNNYNSSQTLSYHEHPVLRKISTQYPRSHFLVSGGMEVLSRQCAIQKLAVPISKSCLYSIMFSCSLSLSCSWISEVSHPRQGWQLPSYQEPRPYWEVTTIYKVSSWCKMVIEF